MEIFIFTIFAGSLLLKWLFDRPSSLLVDRDYISQQSPLSGSDRQRSTDANQIIQLVISNTRAERIEHLQPQLVELDRTYRDLPGCLTHLSQTLIFREIGITPAR